MLVRLTLTNDVGNLHCRNPITVIVPLCFRSSTTSVWAICHRVTANAPRRPVCLLLGSPIARPLISQNPPSERPHYWQVRRYAPGERGRVVDTRSADSLAGNRDCQEDEADHEPSERTDRA